MPKFVTIGYGDEAGYHRTPAGVRDAAHAHDAMLVAGGALMGIAGKTGQVRNPENRKIKTTTGPYLRPELPIAGFGIIEADSLERAIELASKSPCAVAHGVIEVWPLVSPSPSVSPFWRIADTMGETVLGQLACLSERSNLPVRAILQWLVRTWHWGFHSTTLLALGELRATRATGRSWVASPSRQRGGHLINK